MSDLLDLVVHGDPAACRTAATDIGTARTTVTTAVDDVRRAARTTGTWHGQAILDPVGDAADAAADWAGDRLSDAGDALSDVGDAISFWD